MRKVLIVDDEKFIRRGLRTMIEIADTCFKQIFECRNGREALELLKKETVDLVITDIKMSQMNGLAFIKELQSFEKCPSIIILSGYDDFKFAAEAIRYGVKAYLLKPVKKEEIIENLNIIDKELCEQEKLKCEKNNVSKYMKTVKQNQLSFMLTNELSQKDIAYNLENLGIEIFNSSYIIYLIKFYNSEDFLSMENKVEHLRKAIEFYLEENKINGICSVLYDSTIIVTTDNNVLEGIQELLKFNTNDKIMIGVSDLCSGIPEIRKAYEQAQECLKYRILNINNIEIMDFRKNDKLKTNLVIPISELKEIPNIIGTDKFKEVEQMLYCLFDIELLAHYHIRLIEELVESVKQYIIKPIENELPQSRSFESFKEFGLDYIYEVGNICKYIHKLMNYLYNCHEYVMIRKNTLRQYNDIDLAIQYIEQNYNKDLNLAVVANNVCLNYSYFSRQFKEYTKTNFVDYLKKVRIEKAKELLKTADYKIYEIGQLVGYNNPKHFATIFKELTGLSPQEYRQRLLVMNE